MKPRHYVAINAIIIALIILLPGWSITAANLAAETGLLTRVDGRHMITLSWANGMGIGLFNVIALAGLLTIVNTLILTANRLGSPQG